MMKLKIAFCLIMTMTFFGECLLSAQDLTTDSLEITDLFLRPYTNLADYSKVLPKNQVVIEFTLGSPEYVSEIIIDLIKRSSGDKLRTIAAKIFQANNEFQFIYENTKSPLYQNHGSILLTIDEELPDIILKAYLIDFKGKHSQIVCFR